jgi:hypothetical protein
MAKFKEFLIKEEVGLADLGTNVEKLFNSQEFGNQINGAFVSSQWNNTNHMPWKGEGSLQNVHMPVDLAIPSVERTGRITTLMIRKNPIYIKLSDGTECNFTYDEYQKIQGNPAIGKNMTVMFQRHPDDFTRQYSKIDKAIVLD